MGPSLAAALPLSRKARRKEERTQKKQQKNRKGLPSTSSVPAPTTSPRPSTETVAAIHTKRRLAEVGRKGGDDEKVKTTKSKKPRINDRYAHLSPALADAMRRDDSEIAQLEAKLGLSSRGGKEKSRLHKEYAKLECYGDDFGDFLDSLDEMVTRVATNPLSRASMHDTDIHGHDDDDDEDEEADEPDEYDSPSEEEIPMKGSVEDFIIDGIVDDEAEEEEEAGEDEQDENELENDDEAEEEDEVEEVEDHSVDEEEGDDDPADDDNDERADESELDQSSASRDVNSFQSIQQSKDDEDDDEEEDQDVEVDSTDHLVEPDHDITFTYRPTKGEDIYGNKVHSGVASNQPPPKYVPPHLRKSAHLDGVATNDLDEKEQKAIQAIERLLNNALNRLSADTLISVSQSVAQLYSSHPTSLVNHGVWKNIQSACVDRPQLMTGLIPTYVAAMIGVHVQKGDSAQLGEYLIESTVTSFLRELALSRKGSADLSNEEDSVGKKSCNLVLVLCYLYNFSIVHCSLIYDVVRDLIRSFLEVDVELLLLFLSHSGHCLRSDDPLALKEIVLLVQKAATDKLESGTHSTRVDYMVSAMMDLKNNKRRKQDQVFSDQVAKLRKLIGQIKSSVSSSSQKVRSSDSSLRISLQDIINVDKKGRWWKVGASWMGNRYLDSDSTKISQQDAESDAIDGKLASSLDEHLQDEKLLRLAAKYRMNTDNRRAIFCIIMGSADCDDSFEKLVKAGMLKPRTERDTVRVLMECCGNEKNYNKFYAHLASRICDYQPQCKFSFQLAFWDNFKQLDEMTARKAANLAKLLYHLVVVHRSLKLTVLKGIEMVAPQDLRESGMIFLTVFLTNTLDHFDDPADASNFFERSFSHRKENWKKDTSDDTLIDDGEALMSSLTVFLVQILKASPKYKKGSKFKANLKAAVKACDLESAFR